MNTMLVLHHLNVDLNLCLLKTDRKNHLLIISITPIDLHFYYDSNGGIFASNGLELFKLFHDYCSRWLAPPKIGQCWAKKKAEPVMTKRSLKIRAIEGEMQE